MEKIYDFFFKIVTDTKKKLSHRFIGGLLIFMLILLLDNTFGISFHYRVTSRLEELEKAEAILHNPLSDSIAREYASAIKDEIINRKSLIDRSYSLLDSFFLKNIQNNIAPANANTKESIKNKFWYYSSSCGLLVLIGFILFWISIFSKNPDGTFDSLWVRIGIGSILFVAVAGIAGGFLLFLASYLPAAPVKPIFTYIINIGLQLSSILSFYLGVQTSKKRRRKAALKKAKEEEEKNRQWRTTRTY